MIYIVYWFWLYYFKCKKLFLFVLYNVHFFSQNVKCKHLLDKNPLIHATSTNPQDYTGSSIYVTIKMNIVL